MKGEENKISGQKRFERTKGLNRGQRQKQEQKATDGPKKAEPNIEANRRAISVLDPGGGGGRSERGKTKTHLQLLSVSIGHGSCMRPQRG